MIRFLPQSAHLNCVLVMKLHDISRLLVVLFLLAPPISVPAGELITPETPIPLVINHYISANINSASIIPAAGIDDSAFLRRLCLDLAGRIPTVKEQSDYLALPEQERRNAAIEAYLSQADFVFHQANEIDLLLLARIRKDNEWREFLLEATKENRPWSKLFQQVMTPEIEFPDRAGPSAFLRERVRELDDLTNDTAVLFFGVNISCAKCHDHPLVDDWEQRHYYGMASFFKRTYQTKSRLLAEDFQGDVKFTNILGEEKQAEFMFLSSQTVSEPELDLAEEARKQLAEEIKKAKKEDDAKAPTVGFRPREELVRLALSDDEKDFFAKNIVNRVWARLTGRGFVMPLDQMHSENPPSHPELMDWLVRDLKSHDYDLKRLIAGIVRSEVYARSCRWTADSEPPAPELFALGNVRPLNPRQLSLSLIFATTASERLPGLTKPEDWESQRQNFENRSNGFADLLPIPDEGFQVGSDEALMFSNSARFENEFLSAGGDRLLGQLKQVASAEDQLDLAFQSVLSRLPNAEEKAQFLAVFATTPENAEPMLKQIVWALLASPEFRFNH